MNFVLMNNQNDLFALYHHFYYKLNMVWHGLNSFFPYGVLCESILSFLNIWLVFACICMEIFTKAKPKTEPQQIQNYMYLSTRHYTPSRPI